MTTHSDELDRQFALGDEYSTRGVKAFQADRSEEGRDWFYQAIGAYQAALASAPPDDLILVGNLKLCIGARLFGLGDADAALAQYEDVIATMKGRSDLLAGGDATDLYTQAKLNRAECALAAGDQDLARREVEQVLAIVPDHPYAEHLLSRL